MEKSKKNLNVPNLRFPGFEGEWKVMKLEEVMDFKVTNSFSRENLNYENGTVKNIHYGDIHTKFQTLFDIATETVPFINEKINIDRISDENYCKEGDVIFADASEDLNDVGKSIEVINVNGEKLLSGLHTLLARSKENIFYLGFKGYLFKSNQVRTQIQKESQGSKVLSINVGRISKIELSFPSIQEQKRITALLSLLDKRIQTQNKIIQRLESLMQGLRERIFKQQIRFRDENGKCFPDWRVNKLGDVCEIAKSGGTPRSTNKEYYEGDIPFLSISDMTSQGKYLIYTTNSISQLGLDNSSSWIVPVNSIIYSMYASVGFVAINRIPLATSQAVLNLILETNINIEFVYYHLVEFQKKVAKFITTGTQGNLNAETVKGFEIPIPSLTEQNKITSFLSSIDQKIQTEKVILKQLEKQKKYLLQQMFI